MAETFNVVVEIPRGSKNKYKRSLPSFPITVLRNP